MAMNGQRSGRLLTKYILILLSALSRHFDDEYPANLNTFGRQNPERGLKMLFYFSLLTLSALLVMRAYSSFIPSETAELHSQNATQHDEEADGGVVGLRVG